MSDCLTPADFDRYASGRLGEEAAAAVRAHLDSCLSCRNAYEQFRQEKSFLSGAKSLMVDATESLPAPGTGSSPRVKVARQFPKIDGYRITGVLGQGGMGIVYQAVQTKLNRAVALKVLPAIISTANPSAVSRFRREASAAARLHHTHIIPIYDFGESRDGYYYAMELISGRPVNLLIDHFGKQDVSSASPAQLAALLTGLDMPAALTDGSQDDARSTHAESAATASFSGRGRIYHRQVARWIADAADALHYAHGQGIIHRDIKPSNLILSVDGRIMIADFGLAKTADEGSMTMTGAFLGTLRYVSPEQAMAKRVRVDHRTDIYSLGATMYELLCFQPAFPGTDDKEVLGAIIARDPDPPKKIHNAVPHELDTICLKCMEKSPDARYGDARALADDLRRYINDLPIVAKRPGFITRAVKFARRRKAPVVAVTAAVLLIAAGFFSQRQMSRRRAAEADKHYESGMFYAKSFKWAAAEAELNRALERDPRHIKTLIGLIWTKLEHFKVARSELGPGLLEEVNELCRRVLEAHPDHAWALAYRGVALRRLGRHEEAFDAVKAAVDAFASIQGSNRPALEYASWSNLGTLYVLKGELETGLQWLHKGAEAVGRGLDEYYAAQWRNLAALELHLQKPDAVEHIATAIACHRQDIHSWVIRARVHLQLEGHINPREALDAAIVADTSAGAGDPKAKRLRALANLRMGNYEETVKHGRLAIELGDMTTVNHLAIAVAQAKLGNAVEAREQLAKAEAAWPEDLRDPGDSRAAAGTSELWLESADRLIQLRDEAQAALASLPPP